MPETRETVDKVFHGQNRPIRPFSGSNRFGRAFLTH
jgi:hypothetical protein